MSDNIYIQGFYIKEHQIQAVSPLNIIPLDLQGDHTCFGFYVYLKGGSVLEIPFLHLNSRTGDAEKKAERRYHECLVMLKIKDN